MLKSPLVVPRRFVSGHRSAMPNLSEISCPFRGLGIEYVGVRATLPHRSQRSQLEYLLCQSLSRLHLHPPHSTSLGFARGSLRSHKLSTNILRFFWRAPAARRSRGR